MNPEENENESNLVEDLNRILENESQASTVTSASKIHSDIDTLTLQDILNRADTTFIAPNTSMVQSNDTHTSESKNQSRLPSISKNIISMLIDMDNANYNDQEESPSIIDIPNQRDPRLSQTIISGTEPMRIEEDSIDLLDKLEEITPTTCFSSYSDEHLAFLCKHYKERVMKNGTTEDMEILLNINSVVVWIV